jgi:hypothetical protein
MASKRKLEDGPGNGQGSGESSSRLQKRAKVTMCIPAESMEAIVGVVHSLYPRFKSLCKSHFGDKLSEQDMREVKAFFNRAEVRVDAAMEKSSPMVYQGGERGESKVKPLSGPAFAHDPISPLSVSIVSPMASPLASSSAIDAVKAAARMNAPLPLSPPPLAQASVIAAAAAAAPAAPAAASDSAAQPKEIGGGGGARSKSPLDLRKWLTIDELHPEVSAFLKKHYDFTDPESKVPSESLKMKWIADGHKGWPWNKFFGQIQNGFRKKKINDKIHYFGIKPKVDEKEVESVHDSDTELDEPSASGKEEKSSKGSRSRSQRRRKKSLSLSGEELVPACKMVGWELSYVDCQDFSKLPAVVMSKVPTICAIVKHPAIESQSSEKKHDYIQLTSTLKGILCPKLSENKQHHLKYLLNRDARDGKIVRFYTKDMFDRQEVARIDRHFPRPKGCGGSNSGIFFRLQDMREYIKQAENHDHNSTRAASGAGTEVSDTKTNKRKQALDRDNDSDDDDVLVMSMGQQKAEAQESAVNFQVCPGSKGRMSIIGPMLKSQRGYYTTAIGTTFYTKGVHTYTIIMEAVGLAAIGWATRECNPLDAKAVRGIGDDSFSWSYFGYKGGETWHKGKYGRRDVPPWRCGSVITTTLDFTDPLCARIGFTVDGISVEEAHKLETKHVGQGVAPAISLDGGVRVSVLSYEYKKAVVPECIVFSPRPVHASPVAAPSASAAASDPASSSSSSAVAVQPAMAAIATSSAANVSRPPALEVNPCLKETESRKVSPKKSPLAHVAALTQPSPSFLPPAAGLVSASESKPAPKSGVGADLDSDSEPGASSVQVLPEPPKSQPKTPSRWGPVARPCTFLPPAAGFATASATIPTPKSGAGGDLDTDSEPGSPSMQVLPEQAKSKPKPKQPLIWTTGTKLGELSADPSSSKDIPQAAKPMSLAEPSKQVSVAAAAAAAAPAAAAVSKPVANSGKDKNKPKVPGPVASGAPKPPLTTKSSSGIVKSATLTGTPRRLSTVAVIDNAAVVAGMAPLPSAAAVLMSMSTGKSKAHVGQRQGPLKTAVAGAGKPQSAKPKVNKIPKKPRPVVGSGLAPAPAAAAKSQALSPQSSKPRPSPRPIAPINVANLGTNGEWIMD